jgi:hypothetical protein
MIISSPLVRSIRLKFVMARRAYLLWVTFDRSDQSGLPFISALA